MIVRMHKGGGGYRAGRAFPVRCGASFGPDVLSPGRDDTSVVFDIQVSPLPGFSGRLDACAAVSPRATNRSPLRGLGTRPEERNWATGMHTTQPNIEEFSRALEVTPTDSGIPSIHSTLKG